MDIILEKAKRFATDNFLNVSQYEQMLKTVKEILNDIDSKFDKIRFLNFLLEKSNEKYEEHKPLCEKPLTCIQNYGYENIAYYLIQELNKLGVNFDEDTFTAEDQQTVENKFEQIYKDLHEIKLGQQITYDDLKNELNELQDLYFLGKKKWYQLFIGKSAELVAREIISETISKQIIGDVKKALPNLLS
ncbi:MAG: hypothetical protein IPL31_01290 [Saprospiraceae bacterium]|nr:hypothetical protein [Saprospiraceae bacterium]